VTRSAAVQKSWGRAVWPGMRVLLLGRCWEDAGMEEKGLVGPRMAWAVLRRQGSDPGTGVK